MGNVKLVEIDPFKEQLIEVINDFFGCDAAYFDVNPLDLATHLITNGVTGQEWIPVTERLPEDDSHVLAYLRIGEEGRIYPASYAKGVWWDCIFSTPATNTTTHWMPLPEPPKEA